MCGSLEGVGSGGWPGACDGRHLPVWAGSKEERRAGAACSLAPVLPQGDLHPLAWLQRGQSQHRPHLQTDHPWSEVWRVPERKGGLTFRDHDLKLHCNCFNDIVLYKIVVIHIVNGVFFSFSVLDRRMILFSLLLNIYTSSMAQTAAQIKWRRLYKSASTPPCWRPSQRRNGYKWSALLMLRSVMCYIRRCCLDRIHFLTL